MAINGNKLSENKICCKCFYFLRQGLGDAKVDGVDLCGNLADKIIHLQANASY